MKKLRLVRLYRDEHVPDHILHEVLDLMEKMAKSIAPLMNDKDTGICLSALNRLHAALIVHFITKEGLRDATTTEAIGLIKNVEHISGQKVLLDES